MQEYKNELLTMMQGMARGCEASKFKIIPEVDQIMKSINDELGLNYEDLSGPSHKRHLVEGRFIAMKLIKEECKLTLVQIGKLFNRDHATVIYAIRAAQDLQYDRVFSLKLSKVENHLAQLV